MHLIGRNINPQTVFKFKLGYAPAAGASQSLTANLTAAGFTQTELEAAGLSMRGEKTTWQGAKSKGTGGARSKGTGTKDDSNAYDRFRHRLMVPISSASGQVLGFGGRYLAPTKQPSSSSDSASRRPPPKYLNSPETALFKKTETNGYYYAVDDNNDSSVTNNPPAR